MVDLWLGGGGPGSQDSVQRVFYRGERTRPLPILGTTERYVEINFASMFSGRSFTQQEVQRARPVAVIGYSVYDGLFAKRSIDPRCARSMPPGRKPNASRSTVHRPIRTTAEAM